VVDAPIIVDTPDRVNAPMTPPFADDDSVPMETPRPEPRRDYRPDPGRRPYAGPDRRPYGAPGRPLAPGQRFAPRPPFAGDPSVALGEGEELVAGRRPVEEAFVARREARRLLVVPQRRMALEKLVLHATSLRIPVVEVEGGTLTAVAGFDGHQGIALVVAPRRWASPDEVLALAAERSEPALVLVLDSLEDPQNVGTLLRSAEASGVHGAIFPTHRQAPLTPAAVKASAGAVEHLRLAPVDDLAGALADLHARGLRIVGADGDAALTAREADLRGPIAIVVGSEGRGLGSAVRRRCDLLVRIPMHGRIESLNAAVAGSILLYEAAAQRRLPESEPHESPSDDGSDIVPEALDPADEPGDASGDPEARPAPVPEPAESIRRGSRRTVPATLAPEAVPSDGTPSDDADVLLPGEPATDLVEPVGDLDSVPAGDTPQV
jgi:23S rRNA (guanosine2251-2'-O)-methyltransferase